ncbi:unnamed protein product, partial [Mesorhabditis belari]|uniref:Uncharacterized protein n=1 Tax=Mesorhabditis belari TaxID=2138241 RepID=A0AAF3FH04_9BILA
MTATEGRVPFRPIAERAPPIGPSGALNSSYHTQKKPIKKPNLGNEVHPGTSVARRDDRIKSIGSSFEEIRESSEEAECEEPTTSSLPSSSRSPHALVELAFKRSHSLTHQHSLLSPRGARRIGVGCLQRGLSEPLLPPRRKTSFGEYGGSLMDRVDSLSLAPIPETVTPSSPSHHGESLFRQESE